MNRFEKIWNWVFPEGKKRVHSLDVLRAMAILSVIFYHLPKNDHQIVIRALTHFGNLGVDLFFVLSGFLIGGQLFTQSKSTNPISIKSFYLRRFLRTLPNYYFILLVNIFVFGISNYDWRYLFFAQNFGGLYQFTHSWSLCIEEHFYLFFPLIVSFLHKKNKLHKFPFVVLSVLIISFLWRVSFWLTGRPDLIYAQNVSNGYEYFFKFIFYPSIGRLDGIALGTLVAYTKIYNPKLWERIITKSSLLLTGGILFLIALIPFIYLKVGWFNVFFGFPLIAVAFTLILLSAVGNNSLLEKIKIPGLTTTSMLSYSLYLTHSLAIGMVHQLYNDQKGAGAGIIKYLLMMTLTFIFAIALYLLIERPFLLLRHKLMSARQKNT